MCRRIPLRRQPHLTGVDQKQELCCSSLPWTNCDHGRFGHDAWLDCKYPALCGPDDSKPAAFLLFTWLGLHQELHVLLLQAQLMLHLHHLLLLLLDEQVLGLQLQR